MLRAKYMSKIDQLRMREIAFVVVIGLLSIMLIYLVFEIKTNIKQHSIVLVPSQIEGEANIKGNEFSDDLLSAYGTEVVHLAYVYTPNVVRKNFRSLMRFYHPDVHNKAEEELLELAKKVDILRISSSYYIDSIKVGSLNKERYIKIKGTHRTYVRDADKEEKALEITIYYTEVSKRFYVTKIVENEGVKKKKKEVEERL